MTKFYSDRKIDGTICEVGNSAAIVQYREYNSVFNRADPQFSPVVKNINKLCRYIWQIGKYNVDEHT